MKISNVERALIEETQLKYFKGAKAEVKRRRVFLVFGVGQKWSKINNLVTALKPFGFKNN